jgi:dihydropteroate synthase
LSFATWALLQGAQIIRTHDVAETVDVVAVVQALREKNG